MFYQDPETAIRESDTMKWLLSATRARQSKYNTRKRREKNGRINILSSFMAGELFRLTESPLKNYFPYMITTKVKQRISRNTWND